jgi:hypothetical protein
VISGPGLRRHPRYRFEETGSRVRGCNTNFLTPQEVRMAVEQSGAETSPEDASPASVAEAAPSEGAEPEAAGKSGDAGADFEAMKRKFRQALERKHSAQTGANAEDAHGTGKVHGSHGPASVRRSFRRKSGS